MCLATILLRTKYSLQQDELYWLCPSPFQEHEVQLLIAFSSFPNCRFLRAGYQVELSHWRKLHQPGRLPCLADVGLYKERAHFNQSPYIFLHD